MKQILDNRTVLFILFGLIALIYLIGGFVDVMEVDAAQYASMSLEMMQTGNYLELFNRGNDYLDKPPFLFWITGLFFKLFGVSNLTYKLPSILFTIVGLYSTFRLGNLLYDRHTGLLAALVLGSCQAMVLINNDVRTDTILTGSLAFCLWQLVTYFENGKLGNLVLGSVGVGLAMLTKGPIGLMMPVLAIGAEILIKGKWRKLLDPKLFLALPIVALMLIPMCIGLYTQHGAEGLKFYFWTQSFGRLTGENVWVNDTGPLFFIENFLWSFLPWTLLGLAAVGQRVWFLFKNGKNSRAAKEYYTLGGIILVFVAMSLSKYKLQHYVFIAYPLVAILAAHVVVRMKKFRFWKYAQFSIILLVLLLIAALCFYSFEPRWWSWLIFALAAFSVVLVFLRSEGSDQVWLPTFVGFTLVAVLLNGQLYPQLLKYQAHSQAGKWMAERGLKPEQLRAFRHGGHSLDFYLGYRIKWDKMENFRTVQQQDTLFVYTNHEGFDQLNKSFGIPDEIVPFKQFKVQFLKIDFLIPDRREEVLDVNYVLIYYPLSSATANQAIRPAPTSSALSSISKVGV